VADITEKERSMIPLAIRGWIDLGLTAKEKKIAFSKLRLRLRMGRI
jgi:hypothetical protein